MARNLEVEIDQLREQLRQLTENVGRLAGGAGGAGRAPGRDAPIVGPPFPREALWNATAHLARRAEAIGAAGVVTYAGAYRSPAGKGEYRWNRPEQTAEELLGQDDSAVARVLAALGHPQRLALLKAILARPGSAAELIERVGLTSTGQIYHHLNTLQAAGLIRPGENRQFAFVGHQAPAFLMLLTGVWSMLYTGYGTGTWDGDQQTTALPEQEAPSSGRGATEVVHEHHG